MRIAMYRPALKVELYLYRGRRLAIQEASRATALASIWPA